MSKRILLVEDDQNLQLIVSHVLQKAGYEYISALTGEEGLKKLLTCKPDLVILDNMMPVKSGEQVFNEVRTLPKYHAVRDIPFIMLTAKQMDEDQIKQYLEKGMAAFLTKPFGPRELMNVLQNILTTHEIQAKEQHLFRAVSKAKDFLTNLVNTIPNALFIINEDGRIDFYNGGYGDILGYEISELIDQSYDSIIDNGSPTFSDLIQLLNGKDQLTNVDVDLLSRKKRAVPFQFSIAKLYNQSEKMIGVIFVGSDVSEIKKLEQVQVEKEKLATFSETAIAINHEINNPLAPIFGNVQLLLEDETLNDFTRDRLQVVFRNAERIKKITQKLRDIRQPVQTSYLGDTKMVDLIESD